MNQGLPLQVPSEHTRHYLIIADISYIFITTSLLFLLEHTDIRRSEIGMADNFLFRREPKQHQEVCAEGHFYCPDDGFVLILR